MDAHIVFRMDAKQANGNISANIQMPKATDVVTSKTTTTSSTAKTRSTTIAAAKQTSVKLEKEFSYNKAIRRFSQNMFIEVIIST